MATSTKPPRDLAALRPTSKTSVSSGLRDSAWARVRRVQLIRREVREYLSISAIEVLFGIAEHVLEGGRELQPRAGQRGVRAYATVMVTIDLQKCAGYFREPADDATAQRVAELMADSGHVKDKLVTLARPRLAEITGTDPDSIEISLEHHARAEGSKVLLDGDAVGSPRTRTQG